MPDNFVSTPALGLFNGHFNQALTNLLIETPQTGFIAPGLFPILPVLKQSDSYFIIDAKQRAWALNDDTRAPGTLGNIADYGLTYDTYMCADHALVGFVPAEQYANADNPLQPEMDCVNDLAKKTALNEEYNAYAALVAGLSTAAWADTAGTACTLDSVAGQTSIDPIAFLKAEIDAIRLKIGRNPNVLAMDQKVFNALANHPAMVGRVTYTGTGSNPAQITTQSIAQLFGLDDVLVSTAVLNSAVTGQNASNAALWGKDMYLLYRNPSPAIRQPSTGYTITWSSPNGVYGGTPIANKPASLSQGWVVESWPEVKLKANYFRVQKYYTQKIVYASAGLRITGAIS